jgi:hypothetical protein
MFQVRALQRYSQEDFFDLGVLGSFFCFAFASAGPKPAECYPTQTLKSEKGVLRKLRYSFAKCFH